MIARVLDILGAYVSPSEDGGVTAPRWFFLGFPGSVAVLVGSFTIPADHPHFPYGLDVEPD